MLYVDPYSGEVSRRDEPGPVKFIEKLHRNLTMGQPGRYWVGGASLALIGFSDRGTDEPYQLRGLPGRDLAA